LFLTLPTRGFTGRFQRWPDGADKREPRRRERTAYRERVLEKLSGAGFELVGKPLVRDVSRFFFGQSCL
jgi:hypothetical protein